MTATPSRSAEQAPLPAPAGGDKPEIGVLQQPSLVDALAQALRERIISGQVPPGTRLTEASVTAMFSVARQTAKAGLELLVSQGLLRRSARKSAVVPRLSAEDVRDIYLCREIVESRVVGDLAASGAVPPDAERALKAMSHAAHDREFLEHIEADIEFHRALVRGTGSRRVTQMHDAIMGEAQLCIAQVQSKENADLDAITTAHAAILEAIRAGDRHRAKRALRSDLNDARDSLLTDLDTQSTSPTQSEPQA